MQVYRKAPASSSAGRAASRRDHAVVAVFNVGRTPMQAGKPMYQDTIHHFALLARAKADALAQTPLAFPDRVADGRCLRRHRHHPDLLGGRHPRPRVATAHHGRIVRHRIDPRRVRGVGVVHRPYHVHGVRQAWRHDDLGRPGEGLDRVLDLQSSRLGRFGCAVRPPAAVVASCRTAPRSCSRSPTSR